MALRSKAKLEVPVGAIWFFFGSTAPPGWLLCDGGSTTGYVALAAVVGANVPDFRGRLPIGVGTGSGLTARTLGTAYGAETAALATGNMPSHSHGGGYHEHANHTHTHTGGLHGHSGNGHTHGMGHDHGPHAHSGTAHVGAGWGHTHNAVGGEVSSYATIGYFTGVYQTFTSNYAGYAGYASGGAYSGGGENPETGGPVVVLSEPASGAIISSEGSGTAFGTVPASYGLQFIIKT